MAMTTYNQIKEILRDEENLDEDRVYEIADSLVPVYTNEIIQEWTEMPMDYNDGWQTMNIDNDSGITTLMSTDLFLYYSDLTQRAYNEIKGE